MKDGNISSLGVSFTDAQLIDIINWRASATPWEDLTDAFNEKYDAKKSAEALRHAFRRHGDRFELGDKETYVASLKTLRRSKLSSSVNARQNRDVLDFLNSQEDLLAQIRTIVSDVNKKKLVLPKIKKDRTKKNMTLELLLSDIHYGKKTKTFNLEICRKRVREFVSVALKEMKRYSKNYNVERLIVALLGDIIESYTMHGLESARGCEFGNMEQIQSSIESLFHDVMAPLAATGLQIDVPCVTGNHDRTEKERTYQLRGRENATWVIYNTLKLLCEKVGFKNVNFTIEDGTFLVTQVYGNNILFEHGDDAGNTNEETLQKLMNRRARQLKKTLHFMRIGHYHKYVCYGRGEIIVNESVPGPDSYSDIHGFASSPGQTINYYVETNERPTCFYKSFPVYLP